MKFKKITTLLLFAGLLSFKSKAQIQLSADDVLAKGFYKTATDTLPDIQIGTPGISKTWDFTGLKKHLSTNITVAPFIGVIDANLVEIEDGDSTSYFKKSNSSLKLILPDEDLGSIKLNVFNFPFNYLSNSTDSTSNYFVLTGDDIGLPLLDSVKLHFFIKYTSNGDAWGTLKIPTGNFNTLRIKSDILTKIWAEGKTGSGSYFKIPGFDETSTTTEYKWFANGKGYPIASFYTEENSFTYYESGILSAQHLDFEKTKEVIAVNPITDKLILKNTGNQIYDVYITDLNGKTVLSKTLQKGEIFSNDASFLPKGLYILNVNNRESNESYNTKLIK